MLAAFERTFFRFVGRGREVTRINCHHNFAALEEHGGELLWITRKGAISARAGQLGLIPGSMGTRSYVVRGLGNPLSWQSCSHGAGRRCSRTEAKRRYSVKDLREQMGDRTWLADRADRLVDEIPSAYKDIDEVMANQRDLVEVVHTLRQIVNYKGC
jgi:tRNA-splicing ligase RtcB